MTTFSSPRHGALPGRPPLSLALGAVVTAALLTGCGRNTPPSADAPRALIHGAVSSPVFEALQPLVRQVSGDTQPDPGEFDLVIVDGDSFTGGQLRDDPLIQRALRSGVWVVGLDMSEDDKKDGLGGLIGASTPQASRFYMVRQSRPGGRLVYTIVDPAAGAQTDSQAAGQIFKAVRNSGVFPQDAPAAPVPPRLINVTYQLIKPYDPLLPENMNPVFNGTYPACYPGRVWGCSYSGAQPQQQASWSATHTIQLFLDAGNNPQGDFQHVLVTSEGSANPGPTAVNNRDSCSDYNDQCEIAWTQTRFDAGHSFAPGSGLLIKSSSPANVNNAQTVTTGSTFSIGYSQDAGLNASYTYSDSVSKTITAWQALNNSTTYAASWAFASNSPYNGLLSSGYDSSMWFYYFGGVAPQGPNTLSQSNFQYQTQTHWINSQVSRNVLPLSGTDNAYYNDTWVVGAQSDSDPGGNNPYCTWALCGGTTQHYSQYVNGQPWALNLDMSTVIPVNTQSLTFSPNPVTAGQAATATLTLASRTPVDATFIVKSDTSGITPEHDTYTIPAGQASLTFKVLTGAQGCQPQSATISAFYADGQNGVLSVNPPQNCPHG
ncbi:hypothetical protein [Deinococcus aluminii]|uniref:Choice-of-anchor D domain-containing protein n=1 Tax=Deinococcus aluminii TaxID=1656885 RepID=A0ABP9XFM8_9DEIO